LQNARESERNSSEVLSILYLSHDVVALAEEGEPFLKHLLVLLFEIVPFGFALFRLQGRAGQRAGGVFAGED
jgi:hypothetical protein